MPTSTAERLFQLDTALDLAIDRLGDGFEAVARRQAADWLRTGARMVGELPTNRDGGFGARGTARLSALSRGFDDASARGLRSIGTALDAFADVSKQATRALRVAGIDPKLTPAVTDALVAYRQLKLAEFADLQAMYTGRAMAAVRKGVVSGQHAGELVFELQEIFAEWVPRARTLYETAIAEFAQVVSHTKSSGAPQARVYLYTGPIDNRLRPFCKGVVGKVFARAAIDKMDNRQMPNTFLSRGGYNCRHQWRDVSGVPELAKLAGTGRFANATIAAKVAVESRKPRSSRRAS